MKADTQDQSQNSSHSHVLSLKPPRPYHAKQVVLYALGKHDLLSQQQNYRYVYNTLDCAANVTSSRANIYAFHQICYHSKHANKHSRFAYKQRGPSPVVLTKAQASQASCKYTQPHPLQQNPFYNTLHKSPKINFSNSYYLISC